jgi:hypothetical protein
MRSVLLMVLASKAFLETSAEDSKQARIPEYTFDLLSAAQPETPGGSLVQLSLV